jgi:hypothetical protein
MLIESDTECIRDLVLGNKRAIYTFMTSTNDVALEALARRVSAETLTDVRTVRKVLSGKPVRGVVGKRIKEALATAGIGLAAAQG